MGRRKKTDDGARERLALVITTIVALVFVTADVIGLVYAKGINRGVAMILVVEIAATAGIYRALIRKERIEAGTLVFFGVPLLVLAIACGVIYLQSR